MILNEIIKGVETESISGDTAIDISGISYDSRKINKGYLFVAVNGEHSDGHNFIEDAVREGAVAVLYEKPAVTDNLKSEKDSRCSQRTGITFIRVRDSRKSLAYVSANFFMRPSDSLTVIGVTGTNGKTTTTYLIKSILESWGKKVGLVGTIKYMIDDAVYDATHTTPEALEFQGLLHDMLMSGCSYVVTEVSSHALVQKRVDGTVFKAGLLTNLTPEHLDFHKTMENYFISKKRLFTELLDGCAPAIINYDDIWGKKLMEVLKGEICTYGLEAGSDFRATEINNSFEGISFKILLQGSKYKVISPLMGLPNVYNILSAAAVSSSLGVPWDVILEGIRTVKPVEGRFEKLEMGQGFFAVIDYAHTEDALERLIYTARGLTKGKIITVFGCGGERDRGKRPKMGAIATRLSDFVIITTDNPRSEKPADIINDIVGGVVRRNYLTEPDRKQAIIRAVMMAEKNDIVLVAGKGHENYQEIRGQKYTFSDKGVFEEAIRQVVKNK